MDEFAVVIVSLLFLILGIVIGVRVGEEAAKNCVTTKDYWVANLIVFLIGAFVSMFVWATGFVVFAGFTIGMIGGAVAGLKFGFGESSGPWKFHDKTFRVNKDQLDTAESGKGEARRRRRKEGGPEPELMSVAPQTARKTDSNKKGSHKG